MNKINVLIVDDSAFMRQMIKNIIADNPKMAVLDTAKNGKEALEKIRTLKPDVVTMDVEMPVLNGIEALRFLMKENKVPVIMLSSLTKEGADATMEALEAGAVDFIPKPSSLLGISNESFKEQLYLKIETCSQIKMHNYMARTPRTPKKPSKQKEMRQIKKPSTSRKASNCCGNKLVAIGTSTGGPRALQSVIPKFPADIPAAILVVRHMPKGFTKSLADRLNAMSEIKVKEAEDGDVLKVGHCFIAPGDQHLRIKHVAGKCTIALGDDANVSGHKPSVDAMYQSIIDNNIKNSIGVIMTGMGSDGAKGLKAMRQMGARTIGQDEKTCVVYGMPGSAYNIGAVEKEVSLSALADEIMNALED